MRQLSEVGSHLKRAVHATKRCGDLGLLSDDVDQGWAIRHLLQDRASHSRDFDVVTRSNFLEVRILLGVLFHPPTMFLPGATDFDLTQLLLKRLCCFFHPALNSLHGLLFGLPRSPRFDKFVVGLERLARFRVEVSRRGLLRFLGRGGLAAILLLHEPLNDLAIGVALLFEQSTLRLQPVFLPPVAKLGFLHQSSGLLLV